MTRFEEIKTAEELLQYTRIHGIPMDQDSINFMQDVVGHDTVRNLAALAETEDAKRADAFFHLLFTIWNWREAVAFYNQHGNPMYQRLKSKAEEAERLRKAYAEELDARQDRDDKLREFYDKVEKRDDQITDLEKQLEAKDLEILKLKAKLYDYMVKEG